MTRPPGGSGKGSEQRWAAARLLLGALRWLRGLLAAQARGWLVSGRQGLRAAWAARPAPAQAGAILLALALAAAGAAALSAQAGLSARLPQPLDWRAVAALLGRDGRPGDLVVVAPAWLERARAIVPEGLPVLAAGRLDGERLPGVRRVWLVAAPAAPFAGWEAEAELERRAARADMQRLGGLEVTRYELASPSLPLATLAARPPPPARSVLLDLGGLPRRCLVIQPGPGEPLALAFPATRIGRTLAGHATLLPPPGAAQATAPGRTGTGTGGESGGARIAFLVDGTETGALELEPVGGRRAFTVDTSRFAGSTHLLELLATAPGPAPGPICLEALSLP